MTRYRFRKTDTPNGTHTVTTRVGTGPLKIVTSAIVIQPAETQTTNDMYIPHFHKLVNNGKVFVNPYTSVNTKTVGNDLCYAQALASNGDLYRDDFTSGSCLQTWIAEGDYPTVNLDGETAKAQAKVQCLANINATEFDLGTFYAEWDKTRNLHRDVGNTLARIMTTRPALRGRSRKTYKVALLDHNGHPLLNSSGRPRYKTVHIPLTFTGQKGDRSANMANAYLIERYGITPLLRDLENSIHFLMNRKIHKRFTARGTQVLRGSQSTVKPLNFGKGYINVTLTTARVWTVRYGVLYETDYLSRALAGLGLTRPLSVAWETLPYSFVADWFFSVGSWLDAVQNAGFTKTLGAWESIHDVTVHNALSDGVLHRTTADTPGNTWTASLTGGFTKTTVLKQRYPWDAQAPPRPPVGTGFNPTRCVDLAALVLQRIRAKF